MTKLKIETDEMGRKVLRFDGVLDSIGGEVTESVTLIRLPVTREMIRAAYVDIKAKRPPWAVPTELKCFLCGAWVEAKDAAKHYEDNHAEKSLTTKENDNGK